MSIETVKISPSKRRTIARKSRLIRKRNQGVIAHMTDSNQFERLHVIVSLNSSKWNVVPDNSNTPLKTFGKRADAVAYSKGLQPHRKNIVVHTEEGGVAKVLID